MREDVENSVPVGSFHFAGPLFSLSCCSLTVFFVHWILYRDGMGEIALDDHNFS